MYRQVLAFHIRQERPLSEVALASAETLQDEVRRTRPHLIFASAVPPEIKELGLFFWVEVNTADGLEATISANGHSTTIHDVSLDDLLVVVDRAEEELAYEQHQA